MGSDIERAAVLEYMASQAADEKVKLAQKLHTDRLGSIIHDVWDVHTNKARWWVITNPTNRYSQKQFPDLDLALTFHVGLCLRLPRPGHGKLDELWAEPFMACARGLDDARQASAKAHEVEDCQAVGVRAREILVTLMHAAQDVLASEVPEPHPKRSDVRAWAEALGNLLFPGEGHRERRALGKGAMEHAWSFTNWLAHARGARVDDADQAIEVTDLAVGIFTTAVIRRVRGVPERCPECGSQRLSPERASDPQNPGSTYERPACGRCAWRGTPVLVRSTPPPLGSPPIGDCVLMTRPLLTNGSKPRARETTQAPRRGFKPRRRR